MLETLSLAACLLLLPATATPPAPHADRRPAASRLLRDALAEAREHGHACEASLGQLLRAGRAAGRALGDDGFAATLDQVVLDARWRAVTDPAAAQARLTDDLRLAVEDLEFEPRMEADLPEGFPAPTPVRALELKSFPRYRLASAEMGGSRSSGAFWTLFGHIQRNDIPMTAPVETTYGAATDDLEESRMAFLYESTRQGAAGPAGAVEVLDVEPALAVSTGCRGSMTRTSIDAARQRLLDWIDARGDLEVAGPVRTMGYNSPMVPRERRYFEVQLPVRRAPRDAVQAACWDAHAAR